MVGLYLPGVSVILSLILLVIYYSKKRVSLQENKFYVIMIIAELVDSLCVFGLQFEFYYGKTHNFTYIELFNKFDFLMLLLWVSSFFIYLLIVTYGDQMVFKNHTKSLIRPINYLNLIAVITIVVTKIDIVIKDDIHATVGGWAIYLAVIFCMIYVILSLIVVLRNMKNFNKKYLPVFFMLFILLIIIINFTLNPFFVDISFGITLVNLIMYFTIENPDLKILEEFNRNKEIVENTIEDRANMLFKISEEVRSPIRKINYLGNNIIKLNNVKLIHNDARLISIISSNLENIVNSTLNISSIDRQRIKIMNNKYNIYNLFSQIVHIVNNEINSNIEFKYSISNVIPLELYGDATKLKQIICSIIFDEVSSMKEGVIDLDISSIIKYDVSRLIITLMDNGSSLSIKQINDILGNKDELSDIEFEKTNSLKMDLVLTKKMIEFMGGILLIKSMDGCTTYTIVLNQLIASSNNKNESLLNMSLSNKKNVLLIDDDYQELRKIANELKRNNFKVTATLDGRDLIEYLNNNQKFDLVIIDDEMVNDNAVDIIKKIDAKIISDIHFIVMLNKDKEIIKNNYLRDYVFGDYLLKDNYLKEIKRIKDKYFREVKNEKN